ncbi:MAG: EMC3/TMCO1 family protein [Methanobacteriota archaeon]
MMNDKAQGSMFLYMMLFLVIIIVVMPYAGPILGVYFGYVLEPLIGFNGRYPVLTLFLAGLIVVTLSSVLTHFFTDWKKMGENQDLAKSFQKELTEARKTGNKNRMDKLMKMQPELMRRQTEASGGMMKPMVFLVIFIFPIFMWLRTFLAALPSYYFSVPWADSVSFFNSFLWQTWLWLYLIFTLVCGQLLRQGLKWVSWSSWWQNFMGKIRPSTV